MKKYEEIEISGDVGLRIWGNTIEQLFENAGEGMSDLITDVSNIRETEKREFKIPCDSYEDSFVTWLNELVFVFDSCGFIGKSFSVRIDNNTLKAQVSGGYFDPQVNESRLLIKAATYHGLSVKQMNSRWEAVVVFDI